MTRRPARRVPAAERDLNAFQPSYADAFRLDGVAPRPAREWARRSLPSDSLPDRVFSNFIWSGLLGFHLARLGQPYTLAGWSLIVDEPRLCTLDTDGRLMAGRMVFETGDQSITWTTMLRFHHSLAPPVWSAAGRLHRRLAPMLLSSAATRASSRTHVA
jgi:hypothetical protein